MRMHIIAAAVLVLAAALGMYGSAMAEMRGKSMVMEGYIVDTRCAEANKADLGEFVTTHTKACALMPACAASGYNLYSYDQLWEFDTESSEKVHEFLIKPDSTLHVNVEMVHGEGNVIRLISIDNAE